MNGLCPACRRPYDDSTIEWKTISPEEWVQLPLLRQNPTDLEQDGQAQAADRAKGEEECADAAKGSAKGRS